MLDQGRILKIEKDLAWVEFDPSSACATCGACFKASSGKMVLEAENPLGARVGDLVEIEISSAIRALSSFLVFGVPILLLLFGLTLGSFISEIMGIILGIAFLMAGFLSVRLIDKYVAKRKLQRGRIVRIVSHG